IRAGDIARLAGRLVDRGLFLLSVGHILISMAYVVYAGGWGPAFRYAQITDAIAVAIVVGPVLIAQTSSRTRILLACSLFAASWLAIASWRPDTPATLWLKDTLFGNEPGRYSQWSYNFPI